MPLLLRVYPKLSINYQYYHRFLVYQSGEPCGPIEADLRKQHSAVQGRAVSFFFFFYSVLVYKR